MKKTIYLILCTTLVFAAQKVSAQSIEEGRRLTRNEQYEDAEKFFNNFIARDQKKGDGYYWAGINFLEQGDSAAAEKMFDEGLIKSPKFMLNYVGKGHLMLRRGDTTQANAMFAMALKAKKKMRPTVRREIGRAYLMVPDRSKTVMMYNAVRAGWYMGDEETEDFELKLLRGDVLVITNPINLSPAIQQYILSSYLDVSSPLPLLRQAMVYQRVKNYETSMDRLNEALALDPAFAPAYRQKAELFAAMKKSDSAVIFYREYLKRNNNFSARRKFVNALYFNGQYDDAIQQAKELLAIKVVPNLYGVIAYAIVSKNDTSRALNKEGLDYFELYEEKSIRPEKRDLSPSEKFYKGTLLFRNGNREDGWLLQRAALMDTASSATKWYDMAREMQYNAKKYLNAIEILQLKSKKTGAKSSLDQYYLAMSYRLSEQYQLSNDVFNEIVTKDSTYLKGFHYLALNWQMMDPKDSTGNVKLAYMRWMSRMTAENRVTYKRDIAYAYRMMADAEDNRAGRMFDSKDDKAAGYVKTIELYKNAIALYAEVLNYDPEATDIQERKDVLEKFVASLEKRAKKRK